MGFGSENLFELSVRRTLTVALCIVGLVFGVWALPESRVADQFRNIESTLLRSEIIDRAALGRMLAAKASQKLSACDTHSQRALLLMEMPLVEAALRSGDTQKFDLHVQSLETRARQVLECTPRQSFAWLVLFDLEALHGQLNEKSFNLLAMSYETSPNEDWISIRRVIVAAPLVLLTSGSLRDAILAEFQQLIRNGFVDDAARAYMSSSQAARSALLVKVEQLDPLVQKTFSEALQRHRLSVESR